MKTKLTLTSRYNGLSINILMDADKAEKLMTKEEPIEEINEDLDRFTTGFKTIYLTESQAQKIKNYLHGVDYWNVIEYANKTKIEIDSNCYHYPVIIWLDNGKAHELISYENPISELCKDLEIFLNGQKTKYLTTKQANKILLYLDGDVKNIIRIR